jgi:hypothetical protein
MLFRLLLRRYAWAGIAILSAASLCPAQTAHRPGPPRHAHPAHLRSGKHAARVQAKHAAPAAAQPEPKQPLSLLEQPPQPPTITLSGGRLTVKADNSSLVDILNRLEKSGGMSVTGLDQDQRVFGVYGPGNPRDILTQLLEGAGYNMLMLGVTDQGTPRELVLSARGDAPPSPPQSFPQQQPSFQQPLFQRQQAPPPPHGNLNFPVRSPAQMYQQMMQQRQQQQNQQPPQ